MRKFYHLLIIAVFSYTASSQTRSWNGGNGDWNDKSKWTPVGVPVDTDILNFSSASGTISNVPDLALKGIIVNGSDIILNAASGNSKKLIIGNNGSVEALIIQSDATLTIGNNLDIEMYQNNYAKIDGVFIVTKDRKYITDSGGLTKTSIKGVLRNNGGLILSEQSSLEFEEGSIYEHAMDQGIIPTAKWNKNSNCNIEGVISKAPAGINQDFGNFKWNCLNQKSGALAGQALPERIKGNLIIDNIGQSTDPGMFIQLPGTINIGGDLIIHNGTLLAKSSVSTINLTGNFFMSGGIILAIASTSNGVINLNFSGAARQIFAKSGGSFERLNGVYTKGAVNFSILENSIVDFGESVLNGNANFTLAGGGTLITAHAEGISANELSGTIQVTGARIFSHTADYSYTGSKNQKTGTGLPSVVRRLSIDNQSGVQSSGGVALTHSVTITDELILKNGFLKCTKENIITLLDGAIATPYENSFVEGPMRKAGNSAFTFPTGWSGVDGGLIPIGISSLSVSSVIQAEYKRAPATDKGNTLKAPLQHISYCDYWELFPITGNANAVVTLYRNAHSNCNPVSVVQDFNTIRIARSDGTTWNQIGKADGNMNAGEGYINSDNGGININQKDIFYTLGNISISKDPLPVLYDSVTAYLKNKEVIIEWSNLTERDIATYFVERSSNGKDFSIINQHLPISNRDDKASYKSIDSNPLPGTSYYRIKTIEKNTKIIFSKIIRVETDQLVTKFIIYPNPLSGRQVTLSLSGVKDGKFELRIINSAGQYVHKKKIISQGDYSTQQLEIPSHIRSGVYTVLLLGDNYHQSKIFIVQ